MTVSALRRSLQFEEIKRLLHDTDLTFDEIAELCGFADRYTMGKFFRKYEGVPPGEFRRWSRE
jgi:AraC-like DNA-binding protein